MQKSLFLGAITLLLIITGYRFFSKKEAVKKQIDEFTIIVGTAAEFPPFEYVHNDQIVGFDIDLIEEVIRRLGKKMVLKDMPFTTLIPQLQNGSIHIIAAGISPTPERAQLVLFTKPYLETDPLVVISSAKNPIHSLNDLKNKIVLVNEGFTAERFMSTVPDIDLKRLPTVSDAFLSLMSNRADAFVVAANNVKPFFKQYNKDDFSVYIIPDTNEKTAFAVSKLYPALFQEVQTVIDQLTQEGFIEQLKTKWIS